MTDAKSHIEMALKSINSFASGGKLSAQELHDIIKIAEQDNVIDQGETRVLRNIISRIDPAEVDPDLRAQLAELSDKVTNKAKKRNDNSIKRTQ